jgi:hypothetical protein
MARKAKEIIFFDNYDSNYYEYARENLEENGEENPSDCAIWEEVSFLEEINFDVAIKEINNLLSSYVLVTGRVGRWNGTQEGGKVFYTGKDDFSRIIGDLGKDCDYFKFTLKSGKIEIRCSHHDGTNYYTLQNLSEKGYNLFSDWYDGTKLYNLSEREIHQKLAKSRVYTDKIAVNW